MRIALRIYLVLAICLLGIAPASRAEDVLFIGNSFTYGGPENVIRNNGGVPKLVEAIAASKGKTLSTLMLTAGGKDWGYHLLQPVTETDLGVKKWDWVVLQDYSSKATHVGNPEQFIQNGETFYKRIREHSPEAKIVLYQTWALAKGNPIYSGSSGPTKFSDVAQMNAEIRKNYDELYRRLEAIEPGNQVALAPVGQAFDLCIGRYPEINLYTLDEKHANTDGSYLAALVIYATIFRDDPKGATREFFGTAIDASTAEKLQQIAQQAVAARQATP